MADPGDWNRRIIQEFRSNEGVVGGPFKGRPLLLLHHLGARSGVERVSPLAYLRDGDDYVVFASKGGSPINPDWYHNLVANPGASVEVGSIAVGVAARIAGGEERDRLWERAKVEIPAFADYERRTPRTIPVIVLQPRPAASDE